MVMVVTAAAIAVRLIAIRKNIIKLQQQSETVRLYEQQEISVPLVSLEVATSGDLLSKILGVLVLVLVQVSYVLLVKLDPNSRLNALALLVAAEVVVFLVLAAVLVLAVLVLREEALAVLEVSAEDKLVFSF